MLSMCYHVVGVYGTCYCQVIWNRQRFVQQESYGMDLQICNDWYLTDGSIWTCRRPVSIRNVEIKKIGHSELSKMRFFVNFETVKAFWDFLCLNSAWTAVSASDPCWFSLRSTEVRAMVLLTLRSITELETHLSASWNLSSAHLAWEIPGQIPCVKNSKDSRDECVTQDPVR